MLIYGLDFTSAPTRRKPITCIGCQLHENELDVQSAQNFSTFSEFEDWLPCTLQAAWAYTQHEQGYGLTAACDPLEGSIVDPHLLPAPR